MKIKNDSVKAGGMTTELLLGMIIANEVYQEYGKVMVVTSVTDGKHSKTSLHYSGNAADLRIYDDWLPDDNGVFVNNQVVRDEIKRRLCVDYDVVLESNHIHIEFQPRYK